MGEMKQLLLLLLICTAYCDYYPKVGNTLILNDLNIENAIIEYENMVIMFYNGNGAKTMLPPNELQQIYTDFDQLSLNYMEETKNQQIALGKIDCASRKVKICENYVKYNYLFPQFILYSRHDLNPKGIYFHQQKIKQKVQDWITKSVIIETIYTSKGGKQYQERNGIIQLNDRNLNIADAEFQNVFIQYYRKNPDCRNCFMHEHRWKIISDQIRKDYQDQVLVGSINCDKFEQLCKKYSIFPSFTVLHDAQPIARPLLGDQMYEDIIKYAYDTFRVTTKDSNSAKTAKIRFRNEI